MLPFLPHKRLCCPQGPALGGRSDVCPGVQGQALGPEQARECLFRATCAVVPAPARGTGSPPKHPCAQGHLCCSLSSSF